MNQNIVIGVLVAVVLIGGGYFLISGMSASPVGVATTTGATIGDTTPSPSDTTPSAHAPSVITDASVAPSNSTVVVTGKVTPNGAPTSYWYEYGVSTNLGNKTLAQTIGSGWSSIASPAYITGLLTNTQYYFRLTAQNAYGAVNGTTYSFSTNNNPPGQGTPPVASTNEATDIARVSATLNAHVDPHSSQTTFWFEYGPENNFGGVTSFQSAGNGNGSAAVSTDITGLNPLTKYFFRVNAQNQYGTVNGATQSFTTKGPVAVNQPVVTTQVTAAVTNTKATVRGTVNPNGTATTYWFEYSSGSLLGSLLPKTTSHKSAGSGSAPVSVEANLTGLSRDTTYNVRIVADNNGGTVRGAIESFQTTP